MAESQACARVKGGRRRCGHAAPPMHTSLLPHSLRSRSVCITHRYQILPEGAGRRGLCLQLGLFPSYLRAQGIAAPLSHCWPGSGRSGARWWGATRMERQTFGVEKEPASAQEAGNGNGVHKDKEPDSPMTAQPRQGRLAALARRLYRPQTGAQLEAPAAAGIWLRPARWHVAVERACAAHPPVRRAARPQAACWLVHGSKLPPPPPTPPAAPLPSRCAQSPRLTWHSSRWLPWSTGVRAVGVLGCCHAPCCPGRAHWRLAVGACTSTCLPVAAASCWNSCKPSSTPAPCRPPCCRRVAQSCTLQSARPSCPATPRGPRCCCGSLRR